MKKSAWVFGLLLLLPTAAIAQESAGAGRSGTQWSMLSARLLPQNANALHVQIGWPGISGTFRAGISEKLDVGARFSFNYGFENVAFVTPGFKLQGVARLQLVDNPRFNLGLGFEPGVFFYFPGLTIIGITMPIKLLMGIPVGNSLMLNLGMDMPFVVRFLPGTAVSLQMLFGGGLEYALDRNMLLTFNTRFGPNIDFVTGGSASFAFELLMGVAFRL